jgi:hypothetical protein
MNNRALKINRNGGSRKVIKIPKKFSSVRRNEKHKKNGGKCFIP